MTISRRNFLGAVAATASIGFLPSSQAQEQNSGKGIPSQIYKARITSVPTDAICEEWKAAGFDGMEVQKWDASVSEARASRLTAEKHNIKIHSVMRGWTDFNQPDNYDSDIESVKTALRAASAYGAEAVLLVPCRIGGMQMPEPWNFDVDFDPQTLQIKTVAEGDNTFFADYIAAHNTATEATIRAVESLIPTADKEGVRICLENVWNNLWCTPKFFAAFCKYFDDPWVGCYFDLGNHIKYARCEEWIKALGNSIAKLHIKGYKINEIKGKLGGGPGDWIRVDQASVDWKSVRKLLAEIGYNGWITVEENVLSNEEYSRFLDQMIEI